MGTAIRNEETVQEILRAVCAKRELLILVTAYLRFESNFIRLEGSDLHVAASMSREDAMYGLRAADLRMRFPYGVSFLEAPVQLLGFGMVEGRRTLRLQAPKAMQEDDQRGAYRVDRVGRVAVTFSTPKYDLLTGNLLNISTTGALVHAYRDFHEEEMAVGSEMAVTVPLTETIRINAKAKIRHVHGRSVGLEFKPALEDPILSHLSRWVFQKREEDRDRVGRKGVEGVAPALPGEQPKTAAVPRGLVLVSSDAGLAQSLGELMSDVQPLTRVAPTLQALKEALGAGTALFFFHLPSLGLDERRRLKSLVEAVQGKVPFVLLGTDIDTAPLFEMGGELKAASAYLWSPQRGTFLKRLVQGILRRHYEGTEGMLVPKGEE